MIYTITKKIYIYTIYFILLLFNIISAADIIFLDTEPGNKTNVNRITLAAKFYGLELKKVILSDNRDFYNKIKISENTGFILSANVLGYINKEEFFNYVKGNNRIKNNILIIGLNSDLDQSVINIWSDNIVNNCDQMKFKPNEGYYEISSDNQSITQELSGNRIPFSVEKDFREYQLFVNKNFQTVIDIADRNSNNSNPIFGFISHDNLNTFWVSDLNLNHAENISISWEYDSSRFIELAPILMYMKYTFKDACWSAPFDLANFTIDDPWLIEPYGFLNYKDLLQEMKINKFHTTIAFVPWNYNRSKEEVINLFKNNENNYSICIHGNNHDHKEFSLNKTDQLDGFSSKSVEQLDYNIHQAIARMDSFKSITGISYDRIMVFPHGISSKEVFLLLKRNNFAGTFNASNIPEGANDIESSLSNIILINTDYFDFPSIKRFSPLKTSVINKLDQSPEGKNKLLNYKYNIATQLFLDNPVIFYDHHNFFKENIKEFNSTAYIVNEIQPEIIWGSLGKITQYAYKMKMREDKNYNIIMYSNNIIIHNVHAIPLTYFIQKKETLSEKIESIKVNGDKVSFSINDDTLFATINIPSLSSSNVVVQYKNDFDNSNINISESNTRVKVLRYLSDFRDLKLSRNRLGGYFIDLYYKYGFYKFGLLNFFILLSFILVLFLFMRILKKSKIRRQTN